LFKGNIEPIPALLQGVIDHLIQWQLLPEYKRPNGCIINFFEEVDIAYFPRFSKFYYNNSEQWNNPFRNIYVIA